MGRLQLITGAHFNIPIDTELFNDYDGVPVLTNGASFTFSVGRFEVVVGAEAMT